MLLIGGLEVFKERNIKIFEGVPIRMWWQRNEDAAAKWGLKANESYDITPLNLCKDWATQTDLLHDLLQGCFVEVVLL